MVRRARKSTRKPRRRVAGKRTARRRSKTITTNQSAIIKETRTFSTIQSNVGYSFVFTLSDFLRASQLAPNFKLYKAAKVEWVLTPLYNTFQDGSVGTEVSQPYIYQTMNRTQDSQTFNLLDIQAMGCKPKKLTSTYKMSYTPNWCTSGLTHFVGNNGALVRQQTQGLKAEYSYLPCPNNAIQIVGTPDYMIPIDPVDPPIINEGQQAIATNEVVYNGHRLFVDQYNGTGAEQPIAQVTCTVTWLFRDPNNSFFIRDPEPLKSLT